LRAQTRGAALVEAVVLVAVLLVLLLGARALVLRHVAEVRAASEARTCAWMLASAGCPERVPLECTGAIIRRLPGTPWNGPPRGGADWLSGAVLEIPLVHEALAGILPSRVSALYEADLDVSSATKKGVLRLSGQATVPCNARPTTEAILKRVLDAATGGIL
jgi:hypothetical protein